MFKINDLVMYSNNGACRILEETEKDYFGKTEKCFILEPVFGNKMKIFLPLSNPLLLSKLRHLLTKKEIADILKNLPTEGEEFIPIDAERKKKYLEIISSCDQARIIGILKTLYQKREEQIALKKKVHICDEQLIREAEKVLFDEFSLVLGIERKNVFDYITSSK